MKIALAFLLLLLPVFGAESASKAQKEVLATLDTWKQAMLKGDAATLEKLYHPDLTYTHSNAKVETKAESIQNATVATGIAKAIELHDPAVHVYGTTAIVKTKADITNAAGTTSHLDLLMVFLKSPQGWQLLARQATKLP